MSDYGLPLGEGLKSKSCELSQTQSPSKIKLLKNAKNKKR